MGHTSPQNRTTHRVHGLWQARRRSPWQGIKYAILPAWRIRWALLGSRSAVITEVLKITELAFVQPAFMAGPAPNCARVQSRPCSALIHARHRLLAGHICLYCSANVKYIRDPADWEQLTVAGRHRCR